MLVLAATMLLYGGWTLVGGMLLLRDPAAMARHKIPNVPRAPAAQEAVRAFEPALDAIVARHQVGLRVDAVASIVFGLLTLYAVAAVLSRDRHGRLLALLTAVCGIVYQLAELPLNSSIVKETSAAAGPRFAEILGLGSEAFGARSPAEQIAMLEWAIALAAAVEVGWCLLLLIYFGGRRGRELYGLPLRRS
jgi:hypothetical protein